MDLMARRRMMMESGKEPDYLRFTCVSATGSVALTIGAGSPTNAVLEYRVNSGSWNDYTIDGVIALTEGDYVEMRRKKGLQAITRLSTNENNYYIFELNGSISATGELVSLIDCDCSRLLALGYACFYRLFRLQSSLVSIPNIHAASSTTFSFSQSFSGCINSTGNGEFLIDSVLTGNSLYNTFYNCQNVSSYHVNSLNSGAQVFQNNLNCTEFVIDATTPPTIGSNTITGLKSDCIIYVPDNSVNAYKTAQYWDARASYIKGISEKPS